MKKTIMFLGVLSLGLAQAQQGNVGINTDEPKATLEIKPTATNLAGTTNEGIVAPKLSKTRVAGITEPVEGTLVYVTDEATSLISAYTGNDVKVAKIDEKGYYFFDGTEWVKTSNEWVYDETTKRINLKRSGKDTFKNKVFYNAETGQYIDTDSETEIPDTRYSDAFGYINENISLSDLSEAKNISFSLSNNLKARTDKRSGEKFKGLNYYRMNITQDDADTNNFRGNHYDLLVPAGNANNYKTVYGDLSFSSLYGSGTVVTTIGQWGQLNIGNSQTVSGYAAALLGSTGVRTSTKVGALYGVYGRNFFAGADNGTVDLAAAGYFESRHFQNNNTLVKSYKGLRVNTISESKNTGAGISLVGIENNVSHKGQTKYPNQYGIFTYSSVDVNATAPDNHYGLYIHDVRGGAKTNYAIYTNVGSVRFGDNTRIKTDTEAPRSILTVNGTSAFGFNTPSINRTIFAGATGGNMLGGTFIGFGAYPDNTEAKFKTSKENHSTLGKNRFFMFNDTAYGRFFFTPFIASDGMIEEAFDLVNESAMTIIHEGKKVGVGTNSPQQKLDVAGSIKIASTDDTCNSTKAGTIRFVATAKKFQGCTGTAWVDLH